VEYIMTIWYIIWPIGNLVVFWYIFPLFGILYHEKSGNPGYSRERRLSASYGQ
jgi:hypothetical protein